jgi:hypothetical protein
MRTRTYALSIAVALLLGTILFFIRQNGAEASAIHAFSRAIGADTSFQGQATAYKDLLASIGPDAQEVLLRYFPPNPRTHMLNHESGIFIYRTEGLSGIDDCRTYFNGSCYHGFVESMLADRGFGALDTVIALCSKGRPLEEARECSHGVGHAFLIAEGYKELPDAVARCRSSFASSTTAIGDCDDGVFMENNFGGFSVPPADRWYDASDPQFPCDAPQIRADSIAHESCWFMQSQATLNAGMYPALGGDPVNVAAYCATIRDAADRRTCDQGLARQIQAKAGTDLDQILRMCDGAYPADSQACYSDAAESAYGFGAESTAIALCEASGPLSDSCFQTLYERISSTSYHTLDERLAACGRVGSAERVEACSAYARDHSAL